MKKKKSNIVEKTLELLKVKFTKKHTQRVYNKNPYRNTLFGISNILSDYNVKNRSFAVKDRDEIKFLETPFIVSLENDITLIHKVTNDEVLIEQKNKKKNIPFDQFYDAWNGIVLLPEVNPDSKEPNYKEHLIEKWTSSICKYLFAIVLATVFFIGFCTNNVFHHLGSILLIGVSVIGIYIGYLLVQKQVFIPNGQADKICSIIKKGNCNSVLNSSASKIMGVVGWSEIGLSYFISNILIIIFASQLIPYLALINICGLPYSFWSIWYQKYKVKEWCPLCLIVQILLWITFSINLFFGYITIPQFGIIDILLTGCIYATPLLIINRLLPEIDNRRHIEYLERDINTLRLNPNVFSALLKQQPYHKIDLTTSQIIWGNKNAKLLVTVITDPHCYYCAITHKLIEKLLEKAGDEICIQYLFSPFKISSEASSRFLTSVYLSEEMAWEEKREIYNKWFKEGRLDKETFFDKYHFNIDAEAVVAEVEKHSQWSGLDSIYGTPTIFVNGFELPYQYTAEDLIYFLNMEIKK